jgi:predicted RNA-binding Zn-ribbon protein involved in translation (DUF1610 family)
LVKSVDPVQVPVQEDPAPFPPANKTIKKKVVHQDPSRLLLSVPTKPIGQTQPCPFCGEKILAIAKKCRYCGEFVENAECTAGVDEHGDSKPSLLTQMAFGTRKPQFVCPHCGTQDCVYSRRVKVKSGISGGKATGALLTGGLSLLATGLSRKEQKTEAYCDNCKTQWKF